MLHIKRSPATEASVTRAEHSLPPLCTYESNYDLSGYGNQPQNYPHTKEPQQPRWIHRKKSITPQTKKAAVLNERKYWASEVGHDDQPLSKPWEGRLGHSIGRPASHSSTKSTMGLPSPRRSNGGRNSNPDHSRRNYRRLIKQHHWFGRPQTHMGET